MTAELVERDDALAWLVGQAGTWDEGRLLVVTGEAGVGKSALVEAAGAALGVRLWTGWCERLFTPRPLGAIADVAALAGGGLAEVMTRGAAAHEVLPVVLHSLADEPTMLVIEDLHWADEATMDLVVLLARRMAPTGSLLVVTARDELAGDHPLRIVLGQLAEAGVERLRLAPLSLDGVGRLAAESGLDPAALHHRTGGNPFYVTQALAAGGTDLPDSLRHTVQARVAALGGPARRLVEGLSILAGVVPVELALAVGGDDVDAFDGAVSSGLLTMAGGGVAYNHELAREVVAEGLDPIRSTTLNRVALTYLQAHGSDPARLAHHAEEADDRPAAARYARLAAEDAAARGAHRQAAAQYARALRCGDDLLPAERSRLLELGAHEQYLIDRTGDAISWLTEAVDLHAGDGQSERRSHLLGRLSSIQRCGGYRDDAWANGRAAVALAEESSSAARAAAWANLAMLALNSSWVADGLAAVEASLGAVNRRSDPALAAHALNTKGVLRILGGDQAEGMTLLRESLQLALDKGLEEQVGRAYIHLADVAQRHRDFDLAERYREDATLYCDEHSLDMWARYLRVYHGRIDLDQGCWDAATTAARSVLAVGATPLARIVALVLMGIVRARRGDPGADDALGEARVLAERCGELQFVAPVAAAQAEVGWLGGRSAAAVDTDTAAALEECVRRGAAWWAGEIAWWRRACGIDGPVPALAAPPWQLMMEGDLSAAARLWEQMGCPYEQAIAHAFDGPERALGSLDALDQLGARAAAAAVQRRLRATGTRPRRTGPQRRTRTNPAGLTDRQLEVVRLLASGKTNRQIADDLVVSVKTVDHHVSAILAKLDVPTRHAAADRASELDIGS